MGRSVYPVTSQMASASRPNSSGVPMNRARASVARLSWAEAKETAAMTTCWPRAGTATTRSTDGKPSGGPASIRACPVRAAWRACAGGSIGTSRSAPGEVLTIRPCASSTWTVTVSGGTGTGLGSRPWSSSVATSIAPCRAETSSPSISATRRAPASSTAARASATARPAEVTIVSRARRLRRRHHPASFTPQPPSAARR